MVGGGSVCGDWRVLALVLDFREVMLTSPPELAYCAPPPPPQGFFVVVDRQKNK